MWCFLSLSHRGVMLLGGCGWEDMSSDVYSRDGLVDRGSIPLDIDNVHMLLQGQCLHLELMVVLSGFHRYNIWHAAVVSALCSRWTNAPGLDFTVLLRFYGSVLIWWPRLGSLLALSCFTFITHAWFNLAKLKLRDMSHIAQNHPEGESRRVQAWTNDCSQGVYEQWKAKAALSLPVRWFYHRLHQCICIFHRLSVVF